MYHIQYCSEILCRDFLMPKLDAKNMLLVKLKSIPKDGLSIYKLIICCGCKIFHLAASWNFLVILIATGMSGKEVSVSSFKLDKI